MPQIGWLEILSVVIIAILVLGPKEFPIALKKIGSYIGKAKNTLSSFQKEVSSVTKDVDLEEEIRIQDLLSGGLTTQEQMQDDTGLEVDGGILNTAGIFVVGVAKGTLMATVPIITISLAVGFMRRLVKLGAGVGE